MHSRRAGLSTALRSGSRGAGRGEWRVACRDGFELSSSSPRSWRSCAVHTGAGTCGRIARAAYETSISRRQWSLGPHGSGARSPALAAVLSTIAGESASAPVSRGHQSCRLNSRCHARRHSQSRAARPETLLSLSARRGGVAAHSTTNGARNCEPDPEMGSRPQGARESLAGCPAVTTDPRMRRDPSVVKPWPRSMRELCLRRSRGPRRWAMWRTPGEGSRQIVRKIRRL